MTEQDDPLALGEHGIDATTTLMATVADVALVVDRQGIIRRVRATGGHGVVSDEWIDRPWAETVTPESRGKVEALLRDVAARGVSRQREVNHVLEDGDLPVAYTAARLGGNGDVLALGRDLRAVSALQQRLVETQQALERDYWRLRHVETRYRLLFQLAADAVLVVDAASRRIVEANAAAARLFGDTPEGLTGKLFPPGIETTDARAVDDLLGAARSSGRAGDIEVQLRGGRGSVHVSASCFRQGAATFYLVRFVPVGAPTVSTVGAPALVELMAAMPDAVVVTDLAGRVQSANRAFLDLLELSAEEQAVGRSLSEWLGRPGADLQVFLAMLKKHGTLRLAATTARGEHGATTEVELSAAWLPEAEVPCVGFVVRDIGRRVAMGPQGARDLARAVEQLTGLVGRVSLPELVRDTTDLVERHFVEAALEITNDNRTAAAELLGLSRQSLYLKLRRHAILSPDEGDPAATAS